jgi:hypothetical protein
MDSDGAGGYATNLHPTYFFINGDSKLEIAPNSPVGVYTKYLRAAYVGSTLYNYQTI